MAKKDRTGNRKTQIPNGEDIEYERAGISEQSESNYKTYRRRNAGEGDGF